MPKIETKIDVTSVIQWILDHPDTIIAAGQTVIGAVQAAITAWRRFTSGILTHDQLLAEWAATGVNVQAANDAWTAAENA